MAISGSPQAVFSVDAEKAVNDILLDKTRSVLFVGEQAHYRTLPLALGVARGSLDGVFATYYEKGGEVARLKDVMSNMRPERFHPNVRHALEEFGTYLSGLGDTWQTLSDHIYAWRADARYLPRFFEEHPDCPKDAVIWYESPWRQRSEGPVSELLRDFIQSASEVQESFGGIVILGLSTNTSYSPAYQLDELIRHAEQRGYAHFDCGGSFVLRMYDYGYYHRSGSEMPVHSALRGTMVLHTFVKPRKWNASDLATAILQIIFKAAYCGLTNETDGEHMNASLALSHVCHSWRETALNTPTLWASILMYMPSFSDQFSDSAMSIIQRVLRYSGKLPFDLTLSGRRVYGRWDDGQMILPTIIFSGCSNRLYSLTLSGTRRFLAVATLTMSNLHLPSVRTLSLKLTILPWLGNDTVDIASGVFQRLPLLEVLSLARISPTDVLAILGLGCRYLKELSVIDLGRFDEDAEMALHTWLLMRIQAKRMVKKICLETRR